MLPRRRDTTDATQYSRDFHAAHVCDPDGNELAAVSRGL